MGTERTTCGKCHRKCSGQVLAVGEKYFHNYCFTCQECGCEIGEESFYNKDGNFFCSKDYLSIFGEKCFHCEHFLEGEVISALGHTFHLDCFSCNQCKKFFPPGENVIFDGHDYLCEDCDSRADNGSQQPLHQCAGCHKDIESGQALMALDQHWHPQCFTCQKCGIVLHGEYMGKDGFAFCEQDYQSEFGVICASCQGYITGKVLQAGDKHYHPQCSRCAKCGQMFGEGEEMYLQGSEIWHPQCSEMVREMERAEQERIEMQQRKEEERKEAERRDLERYEAERRENERREMDRREAERKEAERREAEQKEAERRDAERYEAERREAERREADRREAERRDAERREAEQKEAERRDAERYEAERRDAERYEAERREAERREAERREAERREIEKKEMERRETERREAGRREAEEYEAKQRQIEREREEQYRKNQRQNGDMQAPSQNHQGYYQTNVGYQVDQNSDGPHVNNTDRQSPPMADYSPPSSPPPPVPPQPPIRTASQGAADAYIRQGQRRPIQRPKSYVDKTNHEQQTTTYKSSVQMKISRDDSYVDKNAKPVSKALNSGIVSNQAPFEIPYQDLLKIKEYNRTRTFDGRPIDTRRLEVYLNDEEFFQQFKFDKKTYFGLPDWRQKRLKQETGLF